MAVLRCALSLGLALCSGGRQQDNVAQLVRQGQDSLYRLEYDAAAGIFRRLIQQHPENPAGYGMLAVVHWNDLLARAGNLAIDDYATPTPFSEGKSGKLDQPDVRQAQDRFHQANAQLLEVCEKLLAKNPHDVSALYFQGVYYENLAAEAVAITRHHTQAIRYGGKAKDIHQQVLALDPDFVDAYVSVASHEYARATLPWSIKWIAFLLGMRGDKEKALQQFELVAARGFYRRLDAQVLLALLDSWRGDPNQAVTRLRSLRSQYPENYLLDINLAAVMEKKLNNAQAALGIYKELANNRRSKAWSSCPGEIHFRTGRLLLALHDDTSALAEFRQAMEVRKAEPETEPLACFYMARIYEQRNEPERAAESYRRVLRYQGSELDSELKLARRKAQQISF